MVTLKKIYELEIWRNKELIKILKGNSIYFEKIGKTQAGYMEVKNEFKANLNEIKKLHKYWFSNYFGENIWA